MELQSQNSETSSDFTFDNFHGSSATMPSTGSFGLPDIPEAPQDTQNLGHYAGNFLNSTGPSMPTGFPSQHAWGGSWDSQQSENERRDRQSSMGSVLSISSPPDLSSSVGFDIHTSPRNSAYVYDQSFSSDPSLVSPSSSSDWQLPSANLSPITPESHYAGGFNNPYPGASSSGQFFTAPYSESSM